MGVTHRLAAIVGRLEGRVASWRVHSPVGERPDPSRPAGADTLPAIRHIVVLMMENHSFDNYLGVLGRGDGLPLGPDGRPAVTNTGRDGRVVWPHRLAATA